MLKTAHFNMLNIFGCTRVWVLKVHSREFVYWFFGERKSDVRQKIRIAMVVICLTQNDFIATYRWYLQHFSTDLANLHRYRCQYFDVYFIRMYWIFLLMCIHTWKSGHLLHFYYVASPFIYSMQIAFICIYKIISHEFIVLRMRLWLAVVYILLKFS